MPKTSLHRHIAAYANDEHLTTRHLQSFSIKDASQRVLPCYCLIVHSPTAEIFNSSTSLSNQLFTMSDVAVNEQTFASGRYSKRKRTQVSYHMDEMDVSDSESDFESVQTKVRRILDVDASHLTPNRNAKPPHQSDFPRTKSFRSCSCQPRFET
jgi:hypothetical protein